MKPETEYKLAAYFMRLMIAVCIALLFIVVINMAHAEDIIVYQTMPGNANQINREAPKLITNYFLKQHYLTRANAEKLYAGDTSFRGFREV